MAEDSIKLIIEAILKDDEFKQGLKKIKTEADNTSKGFVAFSERLDKVKTGLITAGLAIVGVFKGLDSLRKASEEAETANAQLNMAFQKVTKNADEATKQFSKFAEAQQLVTKYGDEEIKSAAALFVQLNHLSGEALQNVTKATMDFATASRMDLNSAATLVSKTIEGSRNAFAGYGLVLKDTMDPTEKLAKVTAFMNKKYKDFAEIEGKTAAGQMAILKNQINELQESLGAIVSQALLPFLKVIKDVAEWVNKLPNGMKVFILAAATALPLVIGIGSAIGILTPLVATLGVTMGVAFAGIPLALGAIAAAIYVINDAIKNTGKSIREAVDIDGLKKAYDNALKQYEKYSMSALQKEKQYYDDKLKTADEANKKIIQNEMNAISEVLNRKLEAAAKAKENEDKKREEKAAADWQHHLDLMASDKATFDAYTQLLNEGKISIEEYLAQVDQMWGDSNTYREEADKNVMIKMANNFKDYVGGVQYGINQLTTTTQGYFDMLNSNIDNNATKEKNQLATSLADYKAAYKAKYDAGEIDYGTYQTALKRLDQDYEDNKTDIDKKTQKKRAIAARDAFFFNQAAKSADAAMNTALGLTMAAALPPPADVIVAIGVGAIGAAQQAFIWGQEAPVVPNFRKGSNELPSDMLAMVHKGERIIPAGLNNFPEVTNSQLMGAAMRGMESNVTNNSSVNNRNITLSGNTFNLPNVTDKEQFMNWIMDFNNKSGRSLGL